MKGFTFSELLLVILGLGFLVMFVGGISLLMVL